MTPTVHDRGDELPPDALGDVHEVDGVPLVHEVFAVHTSGVRETLAMHVVLAGPEDGMPVVLLHGFPDCWYGWRHQIGPLARAGYRVIVPDQRGYGGTEVLPGVSAYGVRHLAADVVGLLDLLDVGTCHLVGHDWGGGVAWTVASLFPERLRTLTVINCPRPRDLQRAAFTRFDQFRRSWYILVFQIPVVAERLLAAGWAAKSLVATSARGTFTDADLERYAATFTLEHMRAAVRWYRAALRDPGPSGRIGVPTLMLWGRDDVALVEQLAPVSLADVDESELQWLDGVGHWAPHEAPARVNAALLARFAAYGGPDRHVYKIVRPGERDGQDPWPGAPIDLADGFVHLSAADQVDGTLAAHFADAPEVAVLQVDPDRLPPGALRWEVSRGGARFPHLYGPLPAAAVVGER